MPVRGVDLVEQGQGIALDRLFGGRAGTAAVAPVVHQVERMIREGPGESGQVAGHILGIAAEIDQRLGAVPGRMVTSTCASSTDKVSSAAEASRARGCGK